MSTHCRIYLKLKREDKGKIFKANKSLFEIKYCNYETPSVKLDGNYISVYCHFDGYIKGVGESLIKYYNNYDIILNMLLFGDFSYISENIQPYYAWKEEENWDFVQPKLSNEMNFSEEYNYLFNYETNKWYVSKNDTNNFEDLSKILIQIEN